MTFLSSQKDEQRYRVVIALADLWDAKRGQDPDIDKLAQDTIDLQKIEQKAMEIASIALKPVLDFVKTGKLWSAEAEIERAEQLITNQVTNQIELEFIQKALFGTRNDISHQIDTALKTRDTILSAAQQNAIQAGNQMSDFIKQYPD